MEIIGKLVIEMEGVISTYEYADRDSMLRDAAEVYCFSDCSDEKVVSISWGDREIDYVGWLSDMHYRFRFKDTREVVFDEYFPEWDH